MARSTTALTAFPCNNNNNGSNILYSTNNAAAHCGSINGDGTRADCVGKVVCPTHTKLPNIQTFHVSIGLFYFVYIRCYDGSLARLSQVLKY